MHLMLSLLLTRQFADPELEFCFMPLKRLFRTLQFATLLMSSTYGVMFTMLDDYRDKYGIS